MQVKTVPFWPDYVFRSEYSLKPLDEVEAFIKENRHLPEIPSADQMLEEGMDMVDMIRILTQKIEELTLYAIDQQKDIAKLQLLLTHLSEAKED